MSIAELIMQGTNRASNSTSWVGDSLAKLGQNVGQALAQREQQKQAQAILPMFQQSMQESMQLAGQGQSGEAYAKLMPFLTDPSVAQNPFMMPALEAGIKMNQIAADDFLRQSQINAYNTRTTEKASQGMDSRQVYTPEERARMTLLGQTPAGVTYEDQNLISDTTAVSQPTAQGQTGMPANQLDSSTIVEAPLPEEVPMREDGGATEMTYKGPQVKAVENIAASIKSPEYKKALLNSIKNPAPPEQVASFKQFSNQYNSLPEDGKMAVMQDLSVVFDSDKNFEKNKPQLGKNFYPLKPEQSKVIGNNITGIILEPTTQARSFTAGAKSDSTTFGTNQNDIDAYQTLFTTAATELSQGKLGKFLKENGGAFNTTYTETGVKEVTDEETGETRKVPKSVILYQKNLDPNNEKTPVIELTEGQLSALKTIQNSPSRLQQLRAGNSNSSFVRIAPTGPTKEGTKMIPASNTSFKTVAEAEASGLPKGTIVTINGRKARID
jgi:hypothetical protein